MSTLAETGEGSSGHAGSSRAARLERLREGAEQASVALADMARVFQLPAMVPELLLRPVTKTDAASRRLAASADAVIVIDEHGIIQSFNRAAEAIFDYAAFETVGRPLDILLAPADTDGESPAVACDLSGGQLRLPPDVGGRRRDGTWFPLELGTTPIDARGRPLFVLVVRDVGERDRIEAERRKKETRYRTLVEQLPAVTCIAALDEDVRELYVSPQIEALLGFSQEEWLSNPVLWYHQIHPEDRDLLHLEFARGCVTGGPFRAEFRALTRTGDVVWIHGEARVVRDDDGRPLYIQGVAYDVSEEKRAEAAVRASTEQLKASLQEKEVLLKEIHHRVKNNLQVISSLLKLQSGQIKDRSALEIFTESQNRIRSMALVHEKLYASSDLSRVEFGEYVRSLASLLVRSYGSRTASVALAVDIEAVHVGIPVAVPLGLIINELVSNCCKYAFPDGNAGTIRVALHPRDADTLLLSVQDDGVGFPSHVDFRKTETLGMLLVRTLTDQIQGTMELLVDGGTEFRITFPR